MSRALTRTAGVATVVLVASTMTACFAASPEAAPTDALPDAALEVMNQPEFASGQWYISAQDIDTGEVLLDLNADKVAAPGSFVKTYSAGAAWLTWGPDHTLTTPVKQSGELAGGVLTGDLVLVGQGDLTMGGRTKPDGAVDYTDFDHNDANALPGATLTPEDPLTGLNDLAAQVKAAGIDSVNGDVIVDDRLFEGDLVGQPVTPIIINQNVIDVTVTPGEVGEPASAALTPVVAPWTVVSQVETVASGGKTLISAPKLTAEGQISVTGTIAADYGDYVKIYTFDDPATFARTAFIEALGRAGVTVSADPVAVNPEGSLPASDAVEALPTVAELESLPLGEEITYVMKISYNRGAQTLVCRLAVQAGETDCDEGMAELGRVWRDAGLDTLGVSLIDGSGLEGNYITPKNAVDVQTIMAARPDAAEWQATLPILGVDGSLTDVQVDSPAAGKVLAKTGTLLGIDGVNDNRYRVTTKTLGGVMETESGRNVAFTVIVNQAFYDELAGVLEANNSVGAVAAAIQQAY